MIYLMCKDVADVAVISGSDAFHKHSETAILLNSLNLNKFSSLSFSNQAERILLSAIIAILRFRIIDLMYIYLYIYIYILHV